MKTPHFVIIIISISGLLLGASNSVYAPCPVGVIDCGPPPGVTVSTGTDSQFYEKNDTINVQGQVYVQNYSQPIQVHVVNPENITVQSIDAPVINGKFGLNIVANFDKTGFYQIITCVQSWCDRSYFKFVAEPYKLTVNSQDYFIKYKSVADLEKIEADVGADALRIHIANATAQGLQFVIELPRNLIDSKSQNNADMNFTVLVGENQPDKFMQNANFKEITTSYSRTLQIDIPYDPIPDVQGIWDFKIIGTTFLGTNHTILSPLKQIKSGIATQDVKCEQDLQLIIKAEDGSPACVKETSLERLVRQGWWAWNDKVGNTIVNTFEKRDFDSKNCTILETVSSIIGTNGFDRDDLPKDGITYPGKNLTGLVGQVIQFSIKPNSEGYIIFTYDFNSYPGSDCKVTTKDVIAAYNPSTPDISISELLGSPDIMKVDENSVNTSIPPLGNSGDILLNLTSAENLNDHVVKVTYKIFAKPDAQLEKSYYIGFWYHSAVVITVGDSLYAGNAFVGPRYG